MVDVVKEQITQVQNATDNMIIDKKNAVDSVEQVQVC